MGVITEKGADEALCTYVGLLSILRAMGTEGMYVVNRVIGRATNTYT